MEESTGGKPDPDHQLTIDMAKEICMLQRTEKGKQFRQYFIEVEKNWNTPEANIIGGVTILDTGEKKVVLQKTAQKRVLSAATETDSKH